MDQDDCSRRDFLKRFAALSSATLLLNLNSGCHGDIDFPPPTAAYGPPAVGSVSNIWFVDADKALVSLYFNQGVPVDSEFIIRFTRDMDTTAPVGLTLTYADGSVALNIHWPTTDTLSIVPAAPLINNTDYALSLTDATDSSGFKIRIDSIATASFKTIA